MQKIFYILGIAGMGFAFYHYMTKQLALALDWDYKIKDIKLRNLTSESVDLDLVVSILNKSNFALDIKDYAIDIYYEGLLVAEVNNNIALTVKPDSFFDVPINLNLSFEGKSDALINFGKTLLNKKALKIDLVGRMNIVFINIKKEVLFNIKDIEIYENATETLGLNSSVSKVNAFLDKLGIKTF